MRVGLFIACFNDTFFPRTGVATVEVLERLGCEVSFPRNQTCCGQIHFNSGYPAEGAALASKQASVFGDARVIVTPSASCAATLRAHLGDGRGGTPEVYELCTFIANVLGVEDVGARFGQRVTYHPTCSSLRALDVGDAPIRLLRRVRDIDLTELPDAEVCCGFGGTFAVKNAATSSAMLSDKLWSAPASVDT